jgi:hypothetical protein
MVQSTSDHNTFNAGSFRWNNTSRTLNGWRLATGADGRSKTCQPTFIDLSSGDLHLSPFDTCARDSGVTLSPLVAQDIDGDSRPSGPEWDAGADEWSLTTGLFADDFEGGGLGRWRKRPSS